MGSARDDASPGTYDPNKFKCDILPAPENAGVLRGCRALATPDHSGGPCRRSRRDSVHPGGKVSLERRGAVAVIHCKYYNSFALFAVRRAGFRSGRFSRAIDSRRNSRLFSVSRRTGGGGGGKEVRGGTRGCDVRVGTGQ